MFRHPRLSSGSRPLAAALVLAALSACGGGGAGEPAGPSVAPPSGGERPSAYGETLAHHVRMKADMPSLIPVMMETQKKCLELKRMSNESFPDPKPLTAEDWQWKNEIDDYYSENGYIRYMKTWALKVNKESCVIELPDPPEISISIKDGKGGCSFRLPGQVGATIPCALSNSGYRPFRPVKVPFGFGEFKVEFVGQDSEAGCSKIKALNQVRCVLPRSENWSALYAYGSEYQGIIEKMHMESTTPTEPIPGIDYREKAVEKEFFVAVPNKIIYPHFFGDYGVNIVIREDLESAD